MKQYMNVDAVFDRVKRRLEMASGNDRKYERPMDWEEADVIIESLAALRAHNSDSAEPVGVIVATGNDPDVVWYEGPDLSIGAELYLAPPPAKEVIDDGRWKRIYDALAKEGGATWAAYMMIDIEALTNRTPDDEVGNG